MSSQNSSIGSCWSDNHHLSRVLQHTIGLGDAVTEQTNYINLIAADCGWNPLVVGEEMTVNLRGKEYTIKRNK